MAALENKAPIIYYNKEVFFVCDRKKHCNISPSCGKECTLTRDPKHAIKGTKPLIKMAAPEIFRRAQKWEK